MKHLFLIKFDMLLPETWKMVWGFWQNRYSARSSMHLITNLGTLLSHQHTYRHKKNSSIMAIIFRTDLYIFFQKKKIFIFFQPISSSFYVFNVWTYFFRSLVVVRTEWVDVSSVFIINEYQATIVTAMVLLKTFACESLFS